MVVAFPVPTTSPWLGSDMTEEFAWSDPGWPHTSLPSKG